MFVAVFSKRFVATHAVGQLFPSKNLPDGHVKHSVAAAPEHVAQSPWQGSHVFVPVLENFAVGHTEGQVVPSKNLAPEQLKQSVLFGPLHVSHSA